MAVTVSDAGNQAPVLAAIGPRSTAENVNLTFGVSASDPDATIPTLTTSTLPTGASFIDNANGTGTFNWTPNFTQAGPHNVTFYAGDGSLIDSEIVTITVTDAGNQAPVLAAIGPRSVAEGATLNFNATGSDPDGTTPVISAVNIPVNATFVYNGNGSGTFNFTPDYTQANIYNVTFIASDGILADSEIVQITVTNVNLPPVLASIGPRTVTEGLNLNFGISATDADAQTPVLTTSTLPTGATFTDLANGTGTFNWTPTFVQAGAFSVTFYASDGSLIDSEVVSITVNDAGNQPPVLDPIGPKTVAENAILNFQITASDLDGTTPTLSAATVPLNATFVDNGNGTGTFNFNPDYTQAGILSITFKAFDGALVDSEVVQITVTNVNRLPVLNAIGPQTTTEGIILNFAVSATDPDLQTLVLTTSTLPLGATFIDNGTGSGAFSWTPSFTQSGAYNITFRASDGTDVDSEIVTITINEAGNQAPILDSIRAQSIIEGQTLTKIVASTDPDGTTPALTAGTLPTNASFVDHGNGTGTFTYTPSFTAVGLYNVLFISSDGLLADSELVPITVIDAGNQPPVFVSTPDTSINEGDSILVVVRAADPEGSAVRLGVSAGLLGYNFVDSGDGVGVFRYGSGYTSAGIYQISFIASDASIPPFSSADTMQLTINDINRPPIIDSLGPFGVRVGRTLTFTVTASDVTDPNPAHRLFMSASNLPANCGYVDNGNNTGTLNFSPAIGQAGLYTVTFTATDQGVPALSVTRDVQITVVATNNPPVFTVLPGYGTATEGDTLQFGIRATDADGQAITLSMVKGPLNSTFVDSGNGSGVFTFMPSFVQSGLHQAVFQAFDGFDATRSNPVIIQIYEAGNQPPVIEGIQAQSLTEGETLNVLITAYDPDEISLTLTADSLPINATIINNNNGTWTVHFLPSYLQSGNYTVYLTAYDGTSTISTSFPITVIEAGNQPPHITNTISSYTIQEGYSAFSFYVYANDPDSSGKPNMWATGLPTGATYMVHDSIARGTFLWTPDFHAAGTHIIKFYASDSLNPALYDSFAVTIQVTNVNVAPSFIIPNQNRGCL